MYVAELSDSELVFVRTEADDRDEGVSELEIGFVTDGHPVQSRRYTQIAAQFGFDELTPGTDRALPSLRAGFSESIPLNVTERVMKSDQLGSGDEPWVAGAFVENPFRDDAVKQELLDGTPEAVLDDIGDHHLFDFEMLESYDELYCEFKSHHPASEDHDYEMQAASISALERVFGWQSSANVSISARYL
ncbi:hypothetical protein [Halomarina oriensis]|uniref:hypothetical protein n=1 Tax=Halomarina oriensis TaxID=671145 RepID=UPI0013039932|nr:hypothetical protein [Halomarina oriensis]